MITIITGTPGAGKTLYTIQTYVQKLVGSTVTKTHDDGSTEEIPRTIYTNINGLLLDHELIDGGEVAGLNNWHEWAKPGSVIVFDEVQKIWPPRPNGAKVPDYIQALETHRHMGVDFILITQGVMLIDRNLIALAGQHLHIRRLGNTKTCIVYEWDHVSRSLMYSKSIAKKIWRYDKKVFKLYKSAELHTKQKRKLPGILWFLAIAVIVMIWKAPQFFGIFNPEPDKYQIKEPASLPPGQTPITKNQQTQPKISHAVITAPDEYTDFFPRVAGRPWTAPAYDALRQVQQMPEITGAICIDQQCTCYSENRRLDIASVFCQQWVKDRPFNPYKVSSRQTNLGGSNGSVRP